MRALGDCGAGPKAPRGLIGTIDKVSTRDDDATVEYSKSNDQAVDRLIAGRYRLRELLGRGGMATVYRADDESLGRTVAVKIFHAGLAHAQDARRQREETSLLASLNHPGLVTLFDAATDGDDSFLIMEFVDGDDLKARMKAGALDSRSTALIGADIAGALAYIHGLGVVHRDIKPANILLVSITGVTNPTHAKLADFGIARLIESTHLTATGSLIGTASFLSPEQAEGGEVGAASDVYSLGLTLLECLTGDRAFPGTAVESAFARLHRDPTIPLELGPAWIALLSSATARDAAARPTAAEFARTLRSLSDADATLLLPVASAGPAADSQSITVEFGDTEKVALHPSATPSPAAPSRISRKRVIGIAAAAIVIAAAAVGLWSSQAGQSTDAATDTGATGRTGQVSYPAVDGDLGLHLRQLQESVAR